MKSQEHPFPGEIAAAQHLGTRCWAGSSASCVWSEPEPRGDLCLPPPFGTWKTDLINVLLQQIWSHILLKTACRLVPLPTLRMGLFGEEFKVWDKALRRKLWFSRSELFNNTWKFAVLAICSRNETSSMLNCWWLLAGLLSFLLYTNKGYKQHPFNLLPFFHVSLLVWLFSCGSSIFQGCREACCYLWRTELVEQILHESLWGLLPAVCSWGEEAGKRSGLQRVLPSPTSQFLFPKAPLVKSLWNLHVWRLPRSVKVTYCCHLLIWSKATNLLRNKMQWINKILISTLWAVSSHCEWQKTGDQFLMRGISAR